MSNHRLQRFGEALNIIWMITVKDIIDALKNRVVISMVIFLSIILLVPKLLPYVFNQTKAVIPIYGADGSQLAVKLKAAPGISLQFVSSEQELALALCGAVYPEIGLRLPADHDLGSSATSPVEFQGYACWSRRYQVTRLQPKIEAAFSQALGQPVSIHLKGNFLYPPSDGSLLYSLATVNAVLMILMMGNFLVPSLLFEEKETRTMQALLVSPASIGQVVVGKALAGSFYILVTGVVIFAISWAEVTHWGMVILFVVGGGVFSVAMGLLMGSFFDRQQDMGGWMLALLLFLVGAVLVKMLGIQLPALAESLLPWVPSVALAEICYASYSEAVPSALVFTNMGIILAVSAPLYALVIWKVRRSDR